MCKRIRQISKDTKIILGGPHPTICPNHFMEEKIDFDFLVIGEGEITTYELIKAIEKMKI